jgi:predicted permease
MQMTPEVATLTQWLRVGVIILATVSGFAFLVRTRFWFPKYVHWLAVIALAIGLGMLPLIPDNAPINRGEWVPFETSMAVLLFPAIVYVAFIFYGGQRAAYNARQIKDAVRCPNCGESVGLPGAACDRCGQTIPSFSEVEPW